MESKAVIGTQRHGPASRGTATGFNGVENWTGETGRKTAVVTINSTNAAMFRGRSLGRSAPTLVDNSIAKFQ